MAREWSLVPEYAASLESVLGTDATGRLIDELAVRSDELRGYARALFRRWLALA